jgi:hypothetical protein
MTNFRRLTLVLATIMIAGMFSATAYAACGDSTRLAPRFHPQAWQGSGAVQPGSLLRVSDDDDDSIVGMWHVTFTAKGNNPGPPDGAQIDNALVTWHRDGTELMNSARPPQDGDFCMGVWKKTGKNTYKLNHFAWLANDATGGPSGIGSPQGPTRFFEEVTLSPDGNHYTGTFTLDGYDTSGHPVAHITGVLAGTRITLATTVDDLL